MSFSNYVLEESDNGLAVVVTGPWTDEIGDVLVQRGANRLVLNYARGFSAASLDFIKGWPIHELAVLDRTQIDPSPILRLANTLEVLSVQIAPKAAALELGRLHILRSLAGPWRLFAPSIGGASALKSIVTWQYYDTDLSALGSNRLLEDVTVKDAPKLLSLHGVAELQQLGTIRIELARNVSDIDQVHGLARSLGVVGFTKCPSLQSLDAVSRLLNLRHIEFGDCGPIESLRPLASLRALESVYAWGNTRIVDGDLSPLLGLPLLTDLRMKDRPEYSPSLRDVRARIGGNG